MLSAADLARPRLDQARDNHETYRHILDLCLDAIRACNRVRIFQTSFAVPSQVAGRPPFKHEHAVEYVKAKLQRGQFVVRMLPPTRFVLLVCWQHTRPTSFSRKKGPTNFRAGPV